MWSRGSRQVLGRWFVTCSGCSLCQIFRLWPFLVLLCVSNLTITFVQGVYVKMYWDWPSDTQATRQDLQFLLLDLCISQLQITLIGVLVKAFLYALSEGLLLWLLGFIAGITSQKSNWCDAWKGFTLHAKHLKIMADWLLWNGCERKWWIAEAGDERMLQSEGEENMITSLRNKQARRF